MACTGCAEAKKARAEAAAARARDAGTKASNPPGPKGLTAAEVSEQHDEASGTERYTVTLPGGKTENFVLYIEAKRRQVETGGVLAEIH